MKWLKTAYIAHRGYHSGREIPENSIRSFENAIMEGFAIELDLQISKDDKVVVFHDDHLKRMTNIDQYVVNCTYHELKQFHLYDTNETIPLFQEVLEIVNGKVLLMIELKNKGKVGLLESKTYELLKQYQGPFVIQSFNPYSLYWFKKQAPHIIRGQLSGSFRGEKLSYYKKVLLRKMKLNRLSEPHFINYEINYLHQLPKKYKEQKEIPIIGWTARNVKQYKKGMKLCSNVVFEGFNPKYIS